MTNMKGTSPCPHSCCHHASHGERKIHLSFCQQDESQDWTVTPAAVTGTPVNVHHGGKSSCALGSWGVTTGPGGNVIDCATTPCFV